MSETQKHFAQVSDFVRGNTLDIGSGGFPVCAHAISLDLPEEAYKNYNNSTRGGSPIQWRGDALNLPFKDNVLDAVHSSHVLEDFPVEQWPAILREWGRVIKPGGHLIVSVPDRKRFRYRVAHMGQGENLAHKHEAYVGEVSGYIRPMNYEILFDRFVNDTDPHEYSIIVVARKR